MSQASEIIPPTPPSPWRKAGALFILLIGVIGGGGLGYWAFMTLAFKLDMNDPNATVALAPTLDAQLSLNHRLQSSFNTALQYRAPLNTTLTLPVREKLTPTLAMQASIPINQTAVIDTVVPVRSVFNIVIPFDNLVSGKRVRAEVPVTIPVRFNLRVKLTIPIQDTFELAVNAPTAVSLEADIPTPLNTTITSAGPIRVRANLPFKLTTAATLQLPTQSLPLGLRSQPKIGLHSLKLRPAKDD